MHEFWNTLKRIRGMPWLLCAAILGVLLLLFAGEGTSDGDSLSYPQTMEHRIAQMAETLPGVEDVSVLVTLEEDSGSSFYAYGGETENRRICGIAVTCIGGGNARIRLEILDMLCAAFDLTTDRVWVGGKEALNEP